jgi:low affinity Fe/Cu permease
LILMKVVSSIVGKIISLVVFIAIALAGYSQRAQLVDCANSVKSQATATASVNTTCTFFGQEIDVMVPRPSQ